MSDTDDDKTTTYHSANERSATETTVDDAPDAGRGRVWSYVRAFMLGGGFVVVIVVLAFVSARAVRAVWLAHPDEQRAMRQWMDENVLSRSRAYSIALSRIVWPYVQWIVGAVESISVRESIAAVTTRVDGTFRCMTASGEHCWITQT